MRAAALLALAALLACASVRAVDVADTVTAVAIRDEYRSTIKKFVGTYACATDDLIFKADFTTCDFQFVEDVLAKRKTISPIACDFTCASQFQVVTPDCATQFRERMLGDTRFGDEAKVFFADCDVQVPPPKGAGCPTDSPCGIDEETDGVSKQDLVTGAAGSPTEGPEGPVAEPPAGVDAEPPTEEEPAPSGTGAPEADNITSSPPVEAPSPAPGPDDIVPPPIPAPAAGSTTVTASIVALLLAALLAALL